MVGVVKAFSGSGGPDRTTDDETSGNYPLGSWKEGKFSFTSPQAETQWRQVALHSGVHFQNWSQGRKLNEKTQQLAGLGFLPSADIYRGPDGDYYQMTPAAREDPQITALRSTALKSNPGKSDIGTAVQKANARITPQAMALMHQQAPIAGAGSTAAPANDNQAAANDNKPKTYPGIGRFAEISKALKAQGPAMTLGQMAQAADDSVRLGANAVTGNYADNAAAAMNALPALFTDQTVKDAYQANLAEEQAKTEAARERLGLGGAGIDLAAGQLPVVGDLSGLAGDIHMYIDDPSSRTWKNYGLTLLGALPLIPSASKLKHAKEALEEGEEALKSGKTAAKAEGTGDLGTAEVKAADETTPAKAADQPKLAYDENDPASVKVYYERPLQGNEGPNGHVQSKHVGKTVGELQKRLDSEKNIRASSSFTDYETAQRVIHDAVKANDEEIKSWLKNSKNNPLELELIGNSPLGITIRRGQPPAATSNARVVLKKDGRGGFYYHTAYPN
jgi:hypothetical protein